MLLISEFVAWSNIQVNFYPDFQWNGKYRESRCHYVDFSQWSLMIRNQDTLWLFIHVFKQKLMFCEYIWNFQIKAHPPLQGSRSLEFGAKIRPHSQCQKVCFSQISDEKFPIWPSLLGPQKLQMYQLKISIKTVRKHVKVCRLLSFYFLKNLQLPF